MIVLLLGRVWAFLFAFRMNFLLLLLAAIGNLNVYGVQENKFMWGVATAAYQIEGATTADGRGASIWDDFVKLPNKTRNGDDGDIADLSYYMHDVDAELIRDLGVSYYRFSISWSRILPTGRGRVNQAGIDHYNNVINTLLAAGISPVVTLYHWDLPSALEHSMNGWLNADIEAYFVEYANICFAEFGDRVKYWITVNEPLTFTQHGYVSGIHAPGRCSDRLRCAKGNSSTEGYRVAHNVLNTHAAAVELYRKVYKTLQHGYIGITLNIDWSYPLTSRVTDGAAAARRNEFTFAWFADPIFFGDYPESMREYVGDRLPSFSSEQRNRLIGSVDFLGFNHYSSWFVSDLSHQEISGEQAGWFGDQKVFAGKYDVNGTLIGPQGDSEWLNMVPRGMYDALLWVTKRYDKPVIIITENGCDVLHENDLPFPEVLNDSFRIDYLRSYIDEAFRARADGADIRGYMAWSLLDNFEWSDGYSKRFGLYYVDYTSPHRNRYAKASASWYHDRVSDPTMSGANVNAVARTAGARERYTGAITVDSTENTAQSRGSVLEYLLCSDESGRLEGRVWSNFLCRLHDMYVKNFIMHDMMGPHLGVP